MQEKILVPAMGESITEVEVGRLLKPSGSFVKEEDELLELETEKVNQVLYAPFSGYVTWSVEEGEVVKIGGVLGTIEPQSAPSEQEERPPVEEKERESQKPIAPTPPQAPVKPVSKTEEPPSQKEDKHEIGAIGVGRRIMQDEFVAQITHPSSISPPHVESVKQLVDQPRETRRKMSKIRRTIANRLVDALHTAAMLTTFNEVDMSAVMAFRKKHQESFVQTQGVKLGFMSFFVKVVVEALKTYHEFNCYIDGEEIVQRHNYDIGIAVGTNRGLFVPVLRDCETLSFAQIEKQIVSYAQKAHEGKLAIADLEGGGFTITNGGIYGSLLSTPIINPPQVGILGMHKILNRPVVVDQEIVIRPMMYLALSYDHRIVDGKEAVTFLVRVKEILEDPSSLLLIDW